MYGFSFEYLLRKLLQESGYQVVPAEDMGFEPQELLQVADKLADRRLVSAADYNLQRENLTCKEVLDHYFKVDMVLSLPAKKGQMVQTVGLQITNYNEDENAHAHAKAQEKLGKLEGTYAACQEIYLDQTYVLSCYVPRGWQGLGYARLHMDKLVNTIIDSVNEEKPQVIEFSMEL